MRLLGWLVIVAWLPLAGCQPGRASSEPPARRPPAAPHLAGTVLLPGSDGRVHIIKHPDPLGLDASTCFVLVGAAGAQSIACTPPRIEITESLPAP